MKPISLSALVLCALLPLTHAASLQQITTPFGPNPRNLTFHLLVPDTLPPNQAILDVSSRETLTHDGGGVCLGILSIVLLGTYPDVFAAGVAFAGVPFGCYAPAGHDNAGVYGYWNAECATGEVVKTPAKWAALVDAAWPGFKGWRPKVQIFHGTRDKVRVFFVGTGRSWRVNNSPAGLDDKYEHEPVISIYNNLDHQGHHDICDGDLCSRCSANFVGTVRWEWVQRAQRLAP
ncbi:hypothetical protein MFIFM68171_02115 [Madurella fahalii]|uniref:Uncharacterized protein n=1 Tax=Madurella fahalii TaxID=1157608 RepID=A0ABQ0G2E7_9PEZI